MGWQKGKKFSQEHISRRSESIVKSGKKRKCPVIIDGVEHWKCGTCETYKLADEYYKSKKTHSGISNVCKKCHSESCIRTRNKDNARNLNADYMRTARKKNPEKFRDRERIASNKSRIYNKEKISARSELNNAVKRGDIIKPSSCEECGEATKISGHHEDYSKPLDVKWLCYKCHGKLHRVLEFKRVGQ